MMKGRLMLLAAALMVCGCGEKEQETVVYEKPLQNPTKVTLEQVGMTSQVSVTWVDNCTTELGYVIWLKSGSSDATKAATLDPDSTSYLFEEGLTAGTSYSIGVQALGKEDKLCSNTIYKEISLFDWSTLPSSTLKEDYVVTPTCVAVDYNFKNSAEYDKEAWGLCWSSEHTPTIEDAHAHGPKILTLPVRQGIPCSSLDYGKTYKVRGYVTCSKGTVYSNELEVRLGDEPEAIKFDWTEMQSTGMPEDIKVYKTTTKLNGRPLNAWYAIADVKKGNVEFRFEFASGTKKLSKWYSDDQAAGSTDYVLTNAGYFNMSTGKTGDYHVDKGAVDNSTASTVARGIFGVDENQTPTVCWGAKGADGITYFYNDPVMTIANKSLYESCTDSYPEDSFLWTPYYAMCAGPLLVKDGKVMTDVTKENGTFIRNYEQIATDIFTDTDTTPDRTCVGYTEDGKIILFVCDGRITDSKGASIVEAAQIMKGLGCVGAVNFDGGGSTAMMVQGTRVNSLVSSTSGATEDRAVGSVMGFFKK